MESEAPNRYFAAVAPSATMRTMCRIRKEQQVSLGKSGVRFSGGRRFTTLRNVNILARPLACNLLGACRTAHEGLAPGHLHPFSTSLAPTNIIRACGFPTPKTMFVRPGSACSASAADLLPNDVQRGGLILQNRAAQVSAAKEARRDLGRGDFCSVGPSSARASSCALDHAAEARARGTSRRYRC